MATDTPPAPKPLQRLMRRRLAVAEQALELPLLGALPFCTSEPQVSTDCWVSLGGTCRAADAVLAGVAAQQMTTSPGVGALPADIFRGGGGDDRADLHALGGVAGMVNLIHNAGGKTDLVAVGGNSQRRW